MKEKAKKFIELYNFEYIYKDYYTKNRLIFSKFVELLAELHEIDNRVSLFCGTCRASDRIRDGINDIKLYIKRKSIKMEKSKCNYSFKKGNGMGLVVSFKGSTYTNANLTDKVAEELIKFNKKNEGLFEIMPKKEVKKVKETKAKKAKKEAVKKEDKEESKTE